MVKTISVHVTPIDRLITVQHDLTMGWDCRQLYDQAFDQMGLKYGDAWFVVDGERVHPDQLVQEHWAELIMVLNPEFCGGDEPPPPPPASSQGVPPPRSEDAPASSQVPPRRCWPVHRPLIIQEWTHWPEGTEWPVLLHMERNNLTMATAAPNWRHWRERFPHVRHFVSISFHRDVIVLAGVHGMYARHATFMLEMLYQNKFELRWPGAKECLQYGAPLLGNVWLFAEFTGQLRRVRLA